MTVDELRRRVTVAENDLSRRLGQKEVLSGQLGVAQSELATLEVELDEEQKVQDVLNKSAKLAWSKASKQVESIVVRALRAVFPDRNYDFKIEQETKRGVSSVSFTLVEDEIETDIWENGGLGVADIVGFALRIAFLALYRPKLRPFIVWDEPFRFVGEAYRRNASAFVRRVAKDLNIQMVVITHDAAFLDSADQAFYLNKVDGKVVVTDRTVRN